VDVTEREFGSEAHEGIQRATAAMATLDRANPSLLGSVCPGFIGVGDCRDGDGHGRRNLRGFIGSYPDHLDRPVPGHEPPRPRWRLDGL
jgi:hypothetical protein